MDVLQDHIDVCATEQPKLPNLLCQRDLGRPNVIGTYLFLMSEMMRMMMMMNVVP